ncbi:MAG: SDH family Clp fold serine proteinase, partial [Candidatus Binataceae bacterium]
GIAPPAQSPLFWAQQKDRYLRQLLIRDIETRTQRRLIVYFANKSENAQLDYTDPTYFVEMLEDTQGHPVDLMLETLGGFTDSAERVVSILEQMAPDLRVVVAGSAKSNGTMICFLGKTIVMGAASELGPIEPHLQQVPCTVLAMLDFEKQNFVLHHMAKNALDQTKKLATRLLKNGMKKGAPDNVVDDLVNKLLTRQTYFSHGSVIDYKEAITLGLAVEYLPADNELWQCFRLLACMYEADCRANRYLKVFEGNRLSSAIEAPPPAGTTTPT